MRKSLLLLVFSGLCLLTISATAQQTLGSLNGTILDPNGATVAGATVTATDADINVTRTTKTQSNGFFQIFNLPVGTYTVTAEHDGFDTTDESGIIVQEAHANDRQRQFEGGPGFDVGSGDREPDAERDRHHQRLHAGLAADCPDPSGNRQLYPARGALAGRERRIAGRYRHQCGPGQPADLGQRPARHVEHFPGGRCGRQQHFQWQDLQQRKLAALPVQHRPGIARSAARRRPAPRYTARTGTVCPRLRRSSCRSCGSTRRCTTRSKARPAARRLMPTLRPEPTTSMARSMADSPTTRLTPIHFLQAGRSAR